MDPSCLAETMWLKRDEPRVILGRIGGALSLARTMVTEMDMDPEDRPEWISQHHRRHAGPRRCGR